MRLVVHSVDHPLGNGLTAITELSVAVSGILLFFSPQRKSVLLIATGVQLINLALQFPEVPNHRLFSGLIGLAFLLVVREWREIQAIPFSQRWQEFCAVIRCCLIAVYGFAVLHKLNYDFLFGNFSCGRVYGSETLAFLGIPSSAVLQLVPWITLSFEAAIPLMLASRRLSWFGSALGFIFHTALIFHPTKHFIDFTCVMFAALIPTLPKPSVRAPARGFFGEFCFGIGIFLVFVFQIIPIKFGPLEPAYVTLWILFSFLSAWLTSALILPRRSPHDNFAPHTALGAALVGLVIFNGLTPYLGIKNKTSWDMYSNLRLEEGVSNHLVIEHSLDLAGETSTFVTIESTNIPELIALTSGGLLIARLELDRLARRATKPHVTYLWKNQRWEITPENLAPDGYQASYLKKKLLWFRPMVALGKPVPCMR